MQTRGRSRSAASLDTQARRVVAGSTSLLELSKDLREFCVGQLFEGLPDLGRRGGGISAQLGTLLAVRLGIVASGLF